MSCCVQTEHVLQSVPMNLAAGESRQVKQEFQVENVQDFFREGVKLKINIKGGTVRSFAKKRDI